MVKTVNYKEMGFRIMDLRKDRGYTREQFSALAGISHSFLYQIETGKKGFSANNLARMCQILEVNSDYILYGESGSACEVPVREIVSRFEPERMDKVAELLKVVYELTHNL